ncbi:hypothetical protein [Thermomonospora umbrina]|uniref:Carboxypeptidase family protein n=1 Tax=Thermomonospora umbrina TaxID=111806 RepID=A0A3D9SNH6_9ACTN|nr:hypothetical protein [Thermomonospora umbrina]REE97479.1 hypothetical protein DFJ69_2952 [Thermomonospora umbrina]
MRRLLAFLLGGLVTLTTFAPAAPASAETALTVTQAGMSNIQGALRAYVYAESAYDITRIVARLRLARSQEVVATVDEFTLRSDGTPQNGMWRSGPLSLQSSEYDVVMDVHDAGGRLNQFSFRYDHRAATVFSSFEATPGRVDVEHDEVTYRGRLARATGEPVTGVLVQVGGGSSTRTDVDGVFTGRVVVRRDVNLNAYFMGSSDAKPSFSGSVPITHGKVSARFAEFAVDRTQVDQDNPNITYRGRLLYRASDGTERPAPRTRVQFVAEESVRGETVTDAEGRFSATAPVFCLCSVHVRTSDVMVEAVESQRIPISVLRITTRLSMSVQPHFSHHEHVAVGTKLERRSGGGWAPMSYRRLTIGYRGPKPGSTNLVTTAEGHAVWEVKPTRADGWYVRYDDGDRAYAPSEATSDVAVPFRTAFTGLRFPRTAVLGDYIRVRGDLVRTQIPLAFKPDSGLLSLEFSPDNKHWKSVGNTYVPSGQSFGLGGRATRSGYWRMRLWPEPMDQPTVSAAHYVKAARKVYMTPFNASPKPVRKGAKLTVKGLVHTDYPAWVPVRRRPVSIYFLPKGSKKWTYMGRATTNDKGSYSKTFVAVRDGSWRAWVAAQPGWFSAVSASRFVDVR